MFLSGKRALVTGSTSGIGLAVARALRAEGAEVVLSGFGEPEAIAALCEEPHHVVAHEPRRAGDDAVGARKGPFSRFERHERRGVRSGYRRQGE